MRPAIEITHPDGRKETVDLTNDRTVVGRGTQADIRIKDSRISREHCAIEIRGDSVYIVDLGGSNGTWIGSTKILANVREPFPVDSIVHVGPAQLQRISKTPQYNPEQDLESQAFVPVVPQRPSNGGQGGQAIPPPAAAVAA